jgi:hypothetical protein
MDPLSLDQQRRPRRWHRFVQPLSARSEGRTLSTSKNREDVMHAVIRMYSGAGGKQLIDLLQERKNEVEALIRPVQGFVSYTLIRAADGGASVTVCQDKAGTEESMRIAREWIGKNAANIGASPPTVLEGSVILQLK